MQQLTQDLKSGNMQILEVPFPALPKKHVMVRNYYSVISAGTEGKTVTDARKGYIAKARSRQKEVKQVIDMIKTNGISSTYKMVMNKLEAPAALGYSSAGEVIALGEGVDGFKVGDRVACGGATASHADVISVPVNLCAKVPDNVALAEAAFTTIASIALQGIRQADLKIGENCTIIGLGLVGQLTAIFLEASGIKTIGIDVDIEKINTCKKNGLVNVFMRNQEGIIDRISGITDGYGTDAIIITAGTSSLDPVEFAGEIARKKGKVVIVGAVPTGFSRKNYYKKELDLRMSSSYGPGRYDNAYEEKGIDYPIGYVRFTEQRNMQTFLDLLGSKKIEIKPLITHTFDLTDAPDAYSMILKKSEPFSGILIKYEKEKDLEKDIEITAKQFPANEPNIGLIGAGNFAQNMLLPKMKGLCNFAAIATMKGNETRYVGEKYNFCNTYSEADKVINDKQVNTVFIVTRHDTHAEFVLKGIYADKHVYTEKPLALHEKELEKIREAWEKSKHRHLMVGFNRRFAPAIKKVKSLLLDDQPKSINMRINAGMLPADHWVNDPDTGGGRIIGEACHFVDLARYIAGSEIRSVAAQSLDDANKLNNTVVINLGFDNGSIAAINYFSNGNKNLSKENIEVFCGGTVFHIDDFKYLNIYGKSRKKIKYKGQDKGHADEIRAFLEGIRKGYTCPVPFNETYHSMLATFKVLDSIKTGSTIKL